MKKSQETSYYTFATTSKYEQRSSDCVIRSISLALGVEWTQVYDELCALGRKMYRMPNEKTVYTAYLKQKGFEMQPAPRIDGNHRWLAKDFAECTKGRRIIAHVGGHHLSCFINGKIHDIWNCGAYSVGNYWVVKC